MSRLIRIGSPKPQPECPCYQLILGYCIIWESRHMSYTRSKSKPQDSKPKRRSFKPDDLTPQTLRPKPPTLTPKNLYPKTYTPCPKPQSQRPIPRTLSPKPRPKPLLWLTPTPALTTVRTKDDSLRWMLFREVCGRELPESKAF